MASSAVCREKADLTQVKSSPIGTLTLLAILTHILHYGTHSYPALRYSHGCTYVVITALTVTPPHHVHVHHSYSLTVLTTLYTHLLSRTPLHLLHVFICTPWSLVLHCFQCLDDLKESCPKFAISFYKYVLQIRDKIRGSFFLLESRL